MPNGKDANNNRLCGNCLFYQAPPTFDASGTTAVAPPQGECRFAPPSLNQSGAGAWPTVKATDWCGAWSTR